MNIDVNNPKYYENRELSWLSFNQRVLDEATNNENPLLERAKFCAIVSSNLDEFFMVRVASLKEQVKAGYEGLEIAGMTPGEQLDAISNNVHDMVEEQAVHYKRALIPGLRRNGIDILKMDELNEEQSLYMKEFFNDEVYPILTPLAVDSSRPFPLILNMSLNIAALIHKDNEEMFATVQVPSVIPRLVPIPSSEEGYKSFVLLDDLIKANIDALFIGYEVKAKAAYRLTRNSDLAFDEEEAQDLLIEIEKSIKQRKWGEVIRIEIEKNVEPVLLKSLQDAVHIGGEDIYYIDGALDLTFLMKMYLGIKGFEHLKFRDFSPCKPKDLLGAEDIFETIRERDVLLSHPFESFDPVVELITKAAKDKKVLAIKQTLYRVSGQSPIIRALANAADAGKQVTVLVELKARFDEENNIQWARRLERAGCHVIYGLVGLKTHSKVTLIVRRDDDGIRRYVHLGTGNYNDITARLYTDLGMLTCNEKIGSDVSAIFNTISGYSDPPKLHKITMAPTGLRQKFVDLIRREIEHVENGKKGYCILKMNSLCDLEMIRELYLASQAGVKIELIVRGICSLIPGIEGLSENITVRSIVGKYLEHSRTYYYKNGGDEEVYLSSADMMPRNLNRRIELLFPVEEVESRKRLIELLEIQMQDVVKGRIKDSNCQYLRIDRRGKAVINSQEYCEDEAVEAVSNFTEDVEHDMFRPVAATEFRKALKADRDA